MKVCPLCGSRYSSRIDFCFHDGAVLATASAPSLLLGSELDPPEADALDVPAPRTAAPVVAAGPGPLKILDLPPEVEGSDDPGAPNEAPPPPSPLPIAPPPPRAPPPAPAAAAPPPAPGDDLDFPTGASAAAESDDDEPAPAGGVPWWAWAAGGAVLVLLAGGAAFAIGGFGLATATLVGGRDDAPPAPPPTVAPLEFPEAPPEPELPPLTLGVQGLDTDDTAADDTAADDTAADDTEGVADTEAPAAGVADPASAVVAPPAPPPPVAITPLVAAPPPPPPTTPPPAPPPRPATTRPPATSTAATAPSATQAPPAPPPAPENKPPAAGAIQVFVSMAGGGAGAKLAIDDREQVGAFPFEVWLPPGKHAFRVTGPSGTSISVTKDVQPDASGAYRVVFPALP